MSDTWLTLALPMGRFEQQFSDEQIAAVIAARFDRDMAYAEIQAAAKAGDLEIEPFTVSTYTVGEWCRKERRTRDGELARIRPDEALEKMVKRLVHVLDTRVAKIERESNRGRVNPAEIKAVISSIKEAHGLLKTFGLAHGSRGDEQSPEDEEADEILAAAAEG